MKKFLIKLLAYAVLISLVTILILHLWAGKIDFFYNKFTSPRQSSMIIGDSRGLEGIIPSVINNELDGKFDLPMFNYSFTIAQTAYGKPYLNSIKGKLDPETTNGLFILTVNPWVLSAREDDKLSEGEYFEAEMPPHNMRNQTMSPNVEYFFKNYSYFSFNAAFEPGAAKTFLHDDGWLEVLEYPKNDEAKARLFKEQLSMFGKYPAKWKPSQIRVEDLNHTIAFLQKHGQVVLLRMPCSPQLIDLEEGYWRNFDLAMDQVAQKHQIEYLNFSHSTAFPTFDGSHLDRSTGTRFTKVLCDSILKMNIVRKID